MVQTEMEDLSLVVEEADVLYVTRIQKERFASREVRHKERERQMEGERKGGCEKQRERGRQRRVRSLGNACIISGVLWLTPPC